MRDIAIQTKDSNILDHIKHLEIVEQLLNAINNCHQDSKRTSPYFLNRVINVDKDGDSYDIKLAVDSLEGGSQLLSAVVTYHDDRFQVRKLILTDADSVDAASFELTTQSLSVGNTEPVFFNGSNGVDELLAFAGQVKCQRNIFGNCKRGTVEVDDWLKQTLAFQRYRSYNQTLDTYTLFSTHNSFNNKADGYGFGDSTISKLLQSISGGKLQLVWAQQIFTMTDQLRMGVRMIMIDPVMVFGKMRMCHCGTSFPWFDKVLGYLEEKLHFHVDFTSYDLGCSPFDRTLESGLMEVHQWISAPENQNEVIYLHLNDEGAHADRNHQAIIQNLTRDIFGDLLFTPTDKNSNFPSSWPTLNQLVSTGKRVIATNGRLENDYIFGTIFHPGWDYDTAKYFTDYPACGQYPPYGFTIFGGESQVIDPFYNGPKEEGLVVKENIQAFVSCGVTCTSLDLASPELLRTGIWSWAEGHPTGKSMCTVQNASDGRWYSVACGSAPSYKYACQSTSDPSQWVISSADSDCPSGFRFSAPIDGYTNRRLRDAVQNAGEQYVWINYST